MTTKSLTTIRWERDDHLWRHASSRGIVKASAPPLSGARAEQGRHPYSARAGGKRGGVACHGRGLHSVWLRPAAGPERAVDGRRRDRQGAGQGLQIAHVNARRGDLDW